MENQDKWHFRGFYVPDRMRGSVERYINRGIRPGNFLQAVISNDLRNAVGKADDENLHNLPAYVNCFYNYAPYHCWGSKEKMEMWIKVSKANLGEEKGGSEG